MNYKNLVPYFCIVIAALLLYVPFLGAVHLFDWDEINFAECAREMLTSKNYGVVQIGYVPFWEKPPLFIWMQAASMNFSGINAFAARLPNVLCGMFTLLTVFHIGRRVYDRRFALLWTMLYAGSLLPGMYFHSGIIDPWFNLFIFAGIYQFVLYTNEFPSSSTNGTFNTRIILSAACIGLAVLTKGPVAILVFAICFIVWRFTRRKQIMSWKHFFIYGLIVLFVPGIWFLYLAAKGQGGLVLEFILYQVRLFRTEDAGHGGSFFYHWIVLLIGCFPASVFAVRALTKRVNDTPFELHMLKWMRVLFWVVLLLFSVVKTKIIHYSSLCYFPLTYLGAYTLMKICSGDIRPSRLLKFLFTGILLFLSAMFVLLPFIDSFKQRLINAGYVNDPFAAANLDVNAHWNGMEWMTGILLLISGLLFILFFIRRLDFTKTIVFLSTTTLVFTLFLILFVPRIEEYSQRTAINYWIAHRCPDFYLETLGYKSYAQYYYGNLEDHIAENRFYKEFREQNKAKFTDPSRTASENELALRKQWMLEGHIDYPAYFICKNTFENEVRKNYPQLRYTGTKNGFVFWERVP